MEKKMDELNGNCDHVEGFGVTCVSQKRGPFSEGPYDHEDKSM